MVPISNQDPSSETKKKKLMVRTSQRVEATINNAKGGRFSWWLRTLETPERATKGVRSLNSRSAAYREKTCENKSGMVENKKHHREWREYGYQPIHWL